MRNSARVPASRASWRFQKITESFRTQSARVRLAIVTVELETRRDRDDVRAVQIRNHCVCHVSYIQPTGRE